MKEASKDNCYDYTLTSFEISYTVNTNRHIHARLKKVTIFMWASMRASAKQCMQLMIMLLMQRVNV